MFSSSAEVLPFPITESLNIGIKKKIEIISLPFAIGTKKWKSNKNNVCIGENSLLIESDCYFGTNAVYDLTKCAISTKIDPELKGFPNFTIQIMHHLTKHSVILSFGSKDEYESYLQILNNKCGYILEQFKDATHPKPLRIFYRKR